MDAVSLPFLMGNETPERAFNIIVAAHRGAAIVHANGDYSLAWAKDIANARDHQLKRLSEIDELEPVRLAELESVDKGLDLILPHRTYIKYEKFLDKIGVRFLIIAAGSFAANSDAMIVTRTEESTRWISGGTLRCNGPGRHIFPRPEAFPGQRCPLCTGMVSIAR